MNNPKPKEWRAEELEQHYIADYKPINFVDGEGVRCSLYVSGCLFHCEGCYNEATWNFRYGTPYTQELEERIMADLAQPYVQGLTLLGGEPFLNTGTLLPLIRRIRAELPDKDIWSWTGYTWEELVGTQGSDKAFTQGLQSNPTSETADKLEMLQNIDVLVDGRFKLSKKNLLLQFRGSSNQRIIDVKKSLSEGSVHIWDKLNDGQNAVEQVKRETMDENAT
ncbi:anaerobic ribonucleoside-triphosphate reductase activating protein [Lactococcus nasutitermitis]|uniref:Anaerobic ribonucleoside-triphosphate reductase-activating protein n=1 Tax=Lactococcus nasutitermitis TaxID=1652957 RepID=A0ABV9JGW0_9LACT|nr:anaerobic ribonucleoside-triphosphate reductase activating protein [Lactococcus nasutitermitis]